MKSIPAFFWLAITLSASTFAARSELPSDLNCTLSGTNYLAERYQQKVSINDIDRETMRVSIEDAADAEIRSSKNSTTLSFNNGCDNNYEFTFLTQNLVDLKAKRVQSVSGQLAGGERLEGAAQASQSVNTSLSCVSSTK